MATSLTAATLTRERVAAMLTADLSFQAPARDAHPLHALHPFAARFPYGLAGYFINALTRTPSSRDPNSISSDTVLDPMCGSGITLLEGWQAGRSVIGVDLDPLARRQSRARTTALDPQDIRHAGANALRRAEDLHSGASYPAEPLALVQGSMDGATQRFLDYWFFPETQRELAALVLAIRAEPDPDLRNLLEVIFSSTIVTKSGGVSRARDLAHTRPHRVDDKTPRHAIRQFAALLDRAADAYAAVDSKTVGESRIIPGDARNLPLPNESVDLIVTSPPYANALDYMRAHKFSLAWLGDPIPDLTALRAQYIGSESMSNQASQSDAQLPASVQDVIEQLSAQDTPKSRVLQRYFSDMSAAIGEMARVLRPGAAAVIVVGPSTMRGILIPTHQCLADLAANAGLDVVAVAPRHLDRDRRMMPVRAGNRSDTAAGPDLATIMRRIHTEYIIGAVNP